MSKGKQNHSNPSTEKEEKCFFKLFVDKNSLFFGNNYYLCSLLNLQALVHTMKKYDELKVFCKNTNEYLSIDGGEALIDLRP